MHGPRHVGHRELMNSSVPHSNIKAFAHWSDGAGSGTYEEQAAQDAMVQRAGCSKGGTYYIPHLDEDCKPPVHITEMLYEGYLVPGARETLEASSDTYAWVMAIKIEEYRDYLARWAPLFQAVFPGLFVWSLYPFCTPAWKTWAAEQVCVFAHGTKALHANLAFEPGGKGAQAHFSAGTVLARAKGTINEASPVSGLLPCFLAST